MNVRLQIDGHVIVINNTTRENLMNDIKKEVDNLLIILDCSSSMSNIAKEMAQGLNDFIQQQKDMKLDKPCLVTLIEFASNYKEIFNKRPLDQVENIQLKPNGYTALFDSIDYAFSLFKNEDSVTCLIITDGEENSSEKITSKDDIVKIIETKQKHGWNIVYLGSDHDAFSAGTGLGVHQSTSIEYNKTQASVGKMFNKLGEKYSAIRACSGGDMNFSDDDRRELNV